MAHKTTDTVYVLDSNTFITPFKNYYSMSNFPGYWQWLRDTFQQTSGRLVLPEIVYNELTAGQNSEDKLSTWVINNLKDLVYSDYRRDNDFWTQFASVIDHVHNSGFYRDPGRTNWDQLDKADPQLVALAALKKWKIVTFEERVGNLSTKNPMKREPKIPNVAEHFGVECVNVFTLESEFNLIV